MSFPFIVTYSQNQFCKGEKNLKNKEIKKLSYGLLLIFILNLCIYAKTISWLYAELTCHINIVVEMELRNFKWVIDIIMRLLCMRISALFVRYFIFPEILLSVLRDFYSYFNAFHFDSFICKILLFSNNKKTWLDWTFLCLFYLFYFEKNV